MKKFAFLFAAMIAAASFSACNSSEEPDSTIATEERSYTDCFNAIYDPMTGDITIPDVQTKYVFHIARKANASVTCRITITSPGIPDVAATTLELPELPFKFDANKFPYIEATDLAVTNGVTGVNITKLSLRILERYDQNVAMGWDYYPVYALSYVVNNRYNVTVYPTRLKLYAETVTTNLADASSFASSSPTYTLTLDPAKKEAAFAIDGAQFIQTMPAMNMEFPGIPFTVGSANLTMATDALTPTIKGVPQSKFPITNLSATLNPADASGNLTFTCSPMQMGAYGVDATLHFNAPTAQ